MSVAKDLVLATVTYESEHAGYIFTENQERHGELPQTIRSDLESIAKEIETTLSRNIFYLLASQGNGKSNQNE